jgi:chitinase
MKETIYLIVSPYKVERMTKNLPDLKRGEIPIRVELEVAETAFRTPVIVKEVYVEDWREGIDMADVDFEGRAITAEEAQLIRERRLEKMKEILETQGFTVEKAETE